MRKAIPAICSTEPLTVLKRVVSVKSPKVSPSKTNSGKCSSVVSRDNCASTCRRTVTDGFTFVSVGCADASSSMIFHSPGLPSPETVLRKPGGGSLSLAPLKSKYRSAATTGQANKTKATQTMNRNIAPQRNKKMSRATSVCARLPDRQREKIGWIQEEDRRGAGTASSPCNFVA